MIHLGSIAYINSLPVDLGILRGAVDLGPDVELVPDVPSGLNALVLRGGLDVTPVSALHYAQNAERLLLLPDLSVSSESGVQSVLLFSKKPIAQLGSIVIRLTDQGRTTPALLKILLHTRYGFSPMYASGPSTSDLNTVYDQAVLLIGDDALRAADSPEAGEWHVTDLAQEWQEWTGLPFVFAVWTVRKEFLKQNPDAARRILNALYQSRKWAAEHEAELIDEAQQRSGFSPDRLRRYYRELRFDLDAGLIKGMTRYFEEAAKLGFIQKTPTLEWLPEGAQARQFQV